MNIVTGSDTIYLSFQRIITQDNIHEEWDNALQREHEAKLLLQEHERWLWELSNRLEVHATADTDRSQDFNVSLKSLSEASEEMKWRDRVLNHQKRLLKDVVQDGQWLLESLQEAERDLHKTAKWALGPGGRHLKWVKISMPASMGKVLDLASVRLEDKSISASFFEIQG